MTTTLDDAAAQQHSQSTASPLPSHQSHRPPQHQPIPPLIRRNTILLALTQAMVGVGNQTTSTLAPLLAVQILGSATLAGGGASILSISRLAVSYPVGWLTDRYGRKSGLMLGLFLSLMGTLMIGIATIRSSFPLVVLGLFVFGLGFGAAQQLRLAAADMFLPARRGEGLGYVLTGSLIGAVAAPLLIYAAELIGARSGADRLSTVWFLVPAIVIPSMGLVLFIRPDPKTIAQNLSHYYPGYVPPPAAKAAAASTGGLRTWIRHFPLMTGFAASFSNQGVMTMMMVMTSLALDHHGYSLSLISMSVSLHVIGMFGFSIPLGRLSDRLGRRTMMLGGSAITALGSILVPTSPEYIVITSGTFLVGLGWSCVNVASSALITEVVQPGERGRAIGFSDAISQSASIVLPLAGGPLVEWAGLPALAVVAVAVLSVPVIMLSQLREPTPGVYAHA